MKHIFALAVILGFTLSDCKAMKPKDVIVISLSGLKEKTITVHKKDKLLVQLPMKSGTGYVWQVSGEPAFCKQGKTKYENIREGKPGASLNEVISFTIITSGKEDLHFIYHRPFEKGKAPAETKILHLIVQ